MSSSTSISTLNFITQQITIYVGSIILIIGVIGGCLSILVFLSLRTFRENSCTIYLIVMSFANIGQLVTGLFRQILVTGFNIDWTITSLFYCKWRTFFFQACVMISLTSVCFSTIDQYWATCSRPRWQRWCNLKVACVLSVISVTVWHLHAVLYLIYFNQIVMSSGVVICKNTNDIFQLYINYVLSSIIGRVIPLSITFIFGFLAYYNVKHIAHRTIPLIRSQLNKQLTTMVLVQVVFTFFAILPAFVVSSIISYSTLSKDPLISAILQLISLLTICLYYLYFASPFYIYLFVSDRFRRQFRYVLIDIHLNRWCHQGAGVNKITPQNFSQTV